MGRPKKQSDLIYKKSKRSCYLLQYHVVLVTKYKHPVIKGDIEERLHEIIAFLLNNFNCELIEVNSDINHVHILFEAAPQTNLSVLINNIKTVTSRRIRKEFSSTINQFYNEPSLWSDTYFIGTVSELTKTAVQQYIQIQKMEV